MGPRQTCPCRGNVSVWLLVLSCLLMAAMIVEARAQSADDVEHPPPMRGGEFSRVHVSAAPPMIPKVAVRFVDQVMWLSLLLFLSATFAGLTMGIMGVDSLWLEIIAESGPVPLKHYAEDILPIRRYGHQALCTLILSNMLTNVLIVQKMNGVQAYFYELIRKGPQRKFVDEDDGSAITMFVTSTLLILIFTEILPMALCKSKHALMIAAAGVPIVRVAMVLTWPIAWPLGILLDKLIHTNDAGQIFDRNELKKLVQVHYDLHAAKSGLAHSEVKLVLAAMEFQEKVVKDVMTPMEKVYFVKADDVITPDFLEQLWRSGRSRVPVVTKDGNFCDVLLVRDLITFSKGPASMSRAHVTVADVVSERTRNVPTVDWNTSLPNMLVFFQRANTHMAIVHREAVVEITSPTSAASTATPHSTAPSESSKAPPHNHSPTRDHLTLPSSEPGSPTTEYQHRVFPRVDCIKNGEKSGSQSRETVGIVTLEDVVEELILQEIYDEYDSEGVQDEEETLQASSFTASTNSMSFAAVLRLDGAVSIPKPPKRRPRVNFYSYYVHENEDVPLTDGQWWALAYYLVDNCPLFAMWKVGYVRYLLAEVGDVQLRPGKVPPPVTPTITPSISTEFSVLADMVPKRPKPKKAKRASLFLENQPATGNLRATRETAESSLSNDGEAPVAAAAVATSFAPRLALNREDNHKIFAASAASDAMVLYRKGTPSSLFTVVLSGSVDILVGRDGFLSQVRSFRCLGDEVMLVDHYVPEFTAVVRMDTRIVQIPRSKYELLAPLATVHRAVPRGASRSNMLMGVPRLTTMGSPTMPIVVSVADVPPTVPPTTPATSASPMVRQGTNVYGTFVGK